MKLLADHLSSQLEYSLKNDTFDNPSGSTKEISMNQRRLRNTTLVLTGMLSIFGLYLGLRFHLWSFQIGYSPVISWIVIFGCVFMQGLGHYVNGIRTERTIFSRVMTWTTQILMGLFLSLLIYTVIGDVLNLMARPFLSIDQQEQFDVISFYAVTGMTLFSVIIGFVQAQVIGPRLYQVEIPLANLPKAFDGFKIAQISDLHVGPTIGRHYAQSVVNRINALKPHAVVVTGDVVDGPVALLKDEVAPLSQLQSKHGTFVITGNHEYYWNAPEWVSEYQRIGMRALMNEHVILQEDLHSLVLGGTTDYFAEKIIPSHAYDLKQTFAQSPEGAPRILLTHQPVMFKQSVNHKVDLQISGHTHGGQFFPGNIFVRMAQKFFKGLNRHENMWIYVSRGTGYWGPPMRFMVPSEITLLTLRKT